MRHKVGRAGSECIDVGSRRHEPQWPARAVLCADLNCTFTRDRRWKTLTRACQCTCTRNDSASQPSALRFPVVTHSVPGVRNGAVFSAKKQRAACHWGLDHQTTGTDERSGNHAYQCVIVQPHGRVGVPKMVERERPSAPNCAIPSTDDGALLQQQPQDLEQHPTIRMAVLCRTRSCNFECHHGVSKNLQSARGDLPLPIPSVNSSCDNKVEGCVKWWWWVVLT